MKEMDDGDGSLIHVGWNTGQSTEKGTDQWQGLMYVNFFKVIKGNRQDKLWKGKIQL